MNYEHQLIRALDAAPNLTPHDLRGLSGTEFGRQDPNVVITTDLRAFRVMMSEAFIVLGLSPDKEFITETIRHEGEHERAARMLGVHTAQFGLRFFNRAGENKSSFTPFTNPLGDARVSELEEAAMSAYPTHPSSGDIAQVKEAHFSGIDEVAEKAMAHNRARGRRIPLPLSYKQCGRIFTMDLLKSGLTTRPRQTSPARTPTSH